MPELVTLIGTGLRWFGYALLPLALLPIACLAFPSAGKKPALALANAIDRITGTALFAAMVFAFLIILIQITGVVLRYAFGLSFSWLNDSILFAFAGIFMLGAAGTLRDDGHVRVDILRNRFDDRTKALIELLGAYLFIFPICWLILDAGSSGLARSWSNLEPFTESDGLPVLYLFKTFVDRKSVV